MLILVWFLSDSNAYKCTALLIFGRICCLHLQGQTELNPQLLVSSLKSDKPPIYITHKLTSHTYLDPEEGGRIFLQHIGTVAPCHIYQNPKAESTGST
jgi:hypothetical protein